jgi:hypothetical protein
MSKSSMGGCRKKSRKGTGSYARYRNENRGLRNQIRRLERHLRSQPNDGQSWDALGDLK